MQNSFTTNLRKRVRHGLLLYWLPALVVAAGISVGSSLQPPTAEGALDSLSNLGPRRVPWHVVEFALFALVVYRLLWYLLGWRFLLLAPLALGVSVVYGVMDEIHQAFVPGRDASRYDVALDVLGAGVALVLLAVFLVLKRLWRKPSPLSPSAPSIRLRRTQDRLSKGKGESA